jgi:hypothetical protein
VFLVEFDVAGDHGENFLAHFFDHLGGEVGAIVGQDKLQSLLDLCPAGKVAIAVKQLVEKFT